MSEQLDTYLTQSYRREVLGDAVTVEMPPVSDKLIAEIEKEIGRIDGLNLGAHLANRDFVSYTNRRAMLRLLLKLKSERIRQKMEQEDAASRAGTLRGERADANGGDREVPARPEP